VGNADSDEVCLQISNGTNAKYAALSHRWGRREVTACTTTANLGDRTRNIPSSDLSQLFLDAVTVTRRLGLLYLWIDSLCILQDSRDDWERESALMGDVFGNSEITISAVSAEDGSSGFLGPRDTHMVCIKYKKSALLPSEGVMYVRRPKNRLAKVVRECALNNRAWVIQERILAPRILTFAESQVFWECREMVAGEGGSQYTNMAHINRRLIRILQELSLDRTNASLKAGVYAAWRQVVQEASEAGLTYESDRLHTIAGLSRLLQQELRTEYVCGTWMEDLALGISWAPQPRNGTLFTCRLPSVPRAPSWCWSSLEGPINFGRDDLKSCTVCFERITNSLPTIVIDTETNQPSRGLEASWALHVRAHVARCEVTINGVFWRGSENPQAVRPESEDYNMTAKGGGLATLNEAGVLIGGSRFDLQPTQSSLGHYSCLLLLDCILDLDASRYGVGLLLRTNMRPYDTQHTYTRVGRVTLGTAGVEWLRQVELESVCLI
jgi:Heterokaryon incompatibility protein (HET)